MKSASLRRARFWHRPVGVPAALLAALFLGGCGLFRWSGHHPLPEGAPDAVEPRLRSGLSPGPSAPATEDAGAPFSARASTDPARARAERLLPDKPLKDEGQALYYSDLGPDAVDVSNYPTQQKHNYAIYAEVCSRCHGLARSINAPAVSRRYWEFYMLGMRGLTRLSKQPRITKEEREAILDFLDYDSKERKVEGRKEFDDLTEELKRRHQGIVEERLKRLQQDNPSPYLIEETR